VKLIYIFAERWKLSSAISPENFYSNVVNNKRHKRRKNSTNNCSYILLTASTELNESSRISRIKPHFAHPLPPAFSSLMLGSIHHVMLIQLFQETCSILFQQLLSGFFLFITDTEVFSPIFSHYLRLKMCDWVSCWFLKPLIFWSLFFLSWTIL